MAAIETRRSRPVRVKKTLPPPSYRPRQESDEPTLERGLVLLARPELLSSLCEADWDRCP